MGTLHAGHVSTSIPGGRDAAVYARHGCLPPRGKSPGTLRFALGNPPDDFLPVSYSGTVEKGVIKLPSEVNLPDGTRVRVELCETPRQRDRFASAELIGSVDGDGIAATNERVRKIMGCKP